MEQNHDLRWHDAVKRFFKCPCGQRAIALDRLPNKHCRYVSPPTGLETTTAANVHAITGGCRFSHCGLFKWERDGMLKVRPLAFCLIEPTTICFCVGGKRLDLFLFRFSFRRKLGQRSAASSCCLEERSMASSSTASDHEASG